VKVKLLTFALDTWLDANKASDSRGLSRIEVLGRVPSIGERVEGQKVIDVDYFFQREFVAEVTLEPIRFRGGDFEDEVETLLANGWRREFSLVYDHRQELAAEASNR
jgi:hypothetical protein